MSNPKNYDKPKTNPNENPNLGTVNVNNSANNQSKIVIYTVNINSYDIVTDPLVIIPGCDYVCFTDAPIQSKIWKPRRITFSHKDPKKVSRHPKINPHLYFPNYDISIYMDGNQTLKTLPPSFLSAVNTSIIALFPHPKRDCNYLEGKACFVQKLDDKGKIRRQLGLYRAAGHPRNYGLWWGGFIIRRHNVPACIKLMNEWWYQVKHHSRRDQISLPFVLRNNGIQPADLSEGKKIDIYNHPAIALRPHLRKRT